MENKMKLLYIVEAMGGGVFTYIVDLTNELVNQYDIYVAYATRPQTPKDYKTYFDERVHLIGVENFTRSINPVKDLKAMFELKRIAKEVNPDIIHLHSSKAGVLGRWLFNGSKTPLFYTPHGYSFLMSNCSYLKRTIYRSIEWASSKRNCITISCSKGENDETLKLTSKAKYVSNGINMSELQSILDSVKIKSHPFTVFTLGRISYQKNPQLFNEIAKSMPDVRFLWIGDGELKDTLTSPNIEITGWADRKTALTKSLNADVFLLPSLWEGLPISLLEAMYMKKVCIVSNAVGNRDVISNGVNGYVCDSVNEYVSAIRKSQFDSSNLIEQAYSEIREKYNTKVMSNEYHKIYIHSLSIKG